MEKNLGLFLVWGIPAIVAMGLYFWTYTKSGKKWLKNL